LEAQTHIENLFSMMTGDDESPNTTFRQIQ
jgi:hypothetical protein